MKLNKIDKLEKEINEVKEKIVLIENNQIETFGDETILSDYYNLLLDLEKELINARYGWYK